MEKQQNWACLNCGATVETWGDQPCPRCGAFRDTRAPQRISYSDSPRHRPVAAIVRASTEDRKLTVDRDGHPVSITGVSQYSCPQSCPFFNSGCYAENGPMSFATGRLNAYGKRTPEEIAEAEAEGIRQLGGRNPLRLHIVGDSRTNAAASIVAQASAEYAAKHDQPVWTYTHAWREVERSSWGSVSVLASCETEADVAEAIAGGYATAYVAPDAASVPASLAGTKTLVCPQQTGGKPDCARCQVCTRDQKLRGRATIVFLAHGNTKRARAALRARVSAQAARAQQWKRGEG